MNPAINTLTISGRVLRPCKLASEDKLTTSGTLITKNGASIPFEAREDVARFLVYADETDNLLVIGHFCQVNGKLCLRIDTATAIPADPGPVEIPPEKPTYFPVVGSGKPYSR
jgi:hypothetical protein